MVVLGLYGYTRFGEGRKAALVVGETWWLGFELPFLFDPGFDLSHVAILYTILVTYCKFPKKITSWHVVAIL